MKDKLRFFRRVHTFTANQHYSSEVRSKSYYYRTVTDKEYEKNKKFKNQLIHIDKEIEKLQKRITKLHLKGCKIRCSSDYLEIFTNKNKPVSLLPKSAKITCLETSSSFPFGSEIEDIVT